MRRAQDEDRLQRDGGEQARADRRADADVDVPLPMRGAHLGEERHQGADDEDRLQPLAQHDDERLHEEVEGRGLVAQRALGVLEAGVELATERDELGRCRTAGGASAERRERRLELGR